ncbi:MAG: AbrB/MazE/SpoVT family DNA-binding domain-containing protein [Acidobacteriaceae bacterium]|nr:AbrB/MazE/SpoVT family DNA-binding domain-containing protein [Acidobacteriaceae bacterium]MBV9781689.1 AbrB/MazE/SpoVT family DNA-binding domain-containing protein [Acidobacteriaceae bacterium]
MGESTLSTKNQIVVPKEARQALGLKPGDKLLVVARGTRVIVLQKPERYHTALRRLSKRSYSAKYLAKERNSWE